MMKPKHFSTSIKSLKVFNADRTNKLTGRNLYFFPTILIFIISAFFSGCKKNPLDVNISGIDLEVNIHRFDKELFSANTSRIAETVSSLYTKYDDFFDVYSFHVINIGLPTEREFPGYLAMFINDQMNREVYEETLRQYPDLNDLERVFTNAFRRYVYHFPAAEVPELVSYVSRFNHSHFTVDNYIGIGLDQYLGADNPYYQSMRLPLYQRRNMIRDKIPSDVLYGFASVEIPYNDSIDNLLSRIIHQGKVMYFVEALLPDQPDSLLIGFTVDQMRWCRNNEKQMWEYLIEHRLLFSTDPMVIQKITGPAPFTYYFTGESPGRSGVWIGWKIVREFARRNRELSLKEIMNQMDYQKILRESRYNP